MPEVSRITTSNPASLRIASDSGTAAESATLAMRVASGRREAQLHGAAGREVAASQHVLHHALEPQLPAVVGRVDAGDAGRLQGVALVRQDHAAAPAEDLDVSCAPLVE